MDHHDHKSLKKYVKELEQSEYNCFRHKVLYQELQQVVLQKQADIKPTEQSSHNALTKTSSSTSTKISTSKSIPGKLIEPSSHNALTKTSSSTSTKISASKSVPSKRKSNTTMKRLSDFQVGGDFRTVLNKIQTYHSYGKMIDNLEKEVPARTNFLKSIE